MRAKFLIGLTVLFLFNQQLGAWGGKFLEIYQEDLSNQLSQEERAWLKDGEEVQPLPLNSQTAQIQLSQYLISLLYQVRDADEYKQGVKTLVLSVVQLFDPYGNTYSRNVFPRFYETFMQDLEKNINEIREIAKQPIPSYYRNAWMGSFSQPQILANEKDPRLLIEKIVELASQRSQRLLSFLVRGYNVYDLRGEFGVAYAEMLSVGKVLVDKLYRHYQYLNRWRGVSSSSKSAKKIKVKIGDWYEDEAVVEGRRIQGLEGFGEPLIRVDDEEEIDEEKIAETLQWLLETEEVREELKEKFGVSDRKINLSGVEVEFVKEPKTQPIPGFPFPSQQPYFSPMIPPQSYNQMMIPPFPSQGIPGYPQGSEPPMGAYSFYPPYFAYPGIPQTPAFPSEPPFYFPYPSFYSYPYVPYGYGYWPYQGFPYYNPQGAQPGKR